MQKPRWLMLLMTLLFLAGTAVITWENEDGIAGKWVCINGEKEVVEITEEKSQLFMTIHDSEGYELAQGIGKLTDCGLVFLVTEENSMGDKQIVGLAKVKIEKKNLIVSDLWDDVKKFKRK